MRSFVGLPLPENLVVDLVAMTSGMRAGRIVSPEDLHVTLAFLGDVPMDRLEMLHAGLEGVVSASPWLELRGMATFGRSDAPLVAVELAQDPALTALRDKVRRIAQWAGIPLARERFRPHITLVRFGRRAAASRDVGAALALSPPRGLGRVAAPEIALYHSTLSPDGARYDILARYPLGPPVAKEPGS